MCEEEPKTGHQRVQQNFCPQVLGSSLLLSVRPGIDGHESFQIKSDLMDLKLRCSGEAVETCRRSTEMEAAQR